MANAPRAYRKVLAAVLQTHCPQVEVIVVQEALDEAVDRLPTFVVRNELTDRVQTRPLAWVLLYADGESRAVLGITQPQVSVTNVEFHHILASVHAAEVMAQRCLPAVA